MNTMLPPTDCQVKGCEKRANSKHHFRPRKTSSLTEVRNIEGYVRTVHKKKRNRGGGSITLCNRHHNAIHRAFSSLELCSMSKEKQIGWLAQYRHIRKSRRND